MKLTKIEEQQLKQLAMTKPARRVPDVLLGVQEEKPEPGEAHAVLKMDRAAALSALPGRRSPLKLRRSQYQVFYEAYTDGTKHFALQRSDRGPTNGELEAVRQALGLQGITYFRPNPHTKVTHGVAFSGSA